ncbi:DUF881 domain-containing protein [Inediibacterium massiliense]|uniref:DUF881 domain-containing protein n=1 Tax=Inediibacterium massiliense TaxID=1658111 RepID=UPI000A510B62|nr:DUF881 domain-containing protein [Inediibacterium massiliense]
MKHNMWRINILMFCILLGVVIAMQLKNVQGHYQYVPLKVIHDYKLSIESQNKEVEKLKEMLKDRTKSIHEYEQSKEEGGKFKETMIKELEEQKLISGFTDVEGSGVVITLDDSTRELYEGEKAEDVIVHDIYVLNIVNDLKVAGAEAISINGQRLLSMSEMVCAGHTIRINNQVFAQPFIIKAIGDPKKLEAAMLAPESTAQYIKEIYELYVEVNTSINIKIPKFSEEVDFKYLKVVEEGE